MEECAEGAAATPGGDDGPGDGGAELGALQARLRVCEAGRARWAGVLRCGTCRDQPHTPHDAFKMGPNDNNNKKQTSWGPGGPGPTGTFHGPMCKRRELPNVETEMKRQEERGQMQLNVDELEKELGMSQRQVREAEVEKEEATRLSERKGGRRGERAGGGDAGADEED